jgi:hypothetical protein
VLDPLKALNAKEREALDACRPHADGQHIIAKLSRKVRTLVPVLAAGAVISMASTGPANAATHQRLDVRVVTAAASISGWPLSVSCDVEHGGYTGALGHADRSRRVIEVQPFVCRRLNLLVGIQPPPYSSASFAAAQALLILVHEAVHLSSYAGANDEALTECRAIQLVDETALALGADDDRATALGHEALRFDSRLPGPQNWMVQMREIPSYHSPGCYDGGPLDIHPNSAGWPN